MREWTNRLMVKRYKIVLNEGEWLFVKRDLTMRCSSVEETKMKEKHTI